MVTADCREIRFHHPHRFLKLWISGPVPSSLMDMPRAKKKQDRRLKHGQTHSLPMEIFDRLLAQVLDSRRFSVGLLRQKKFDLNVQFKFKRGSIGVESIYCSIRSKLRGLQKTAFEYHIHSSRTFQHAFSILTLRILEKGTSSQKLL